MKRSNPFREVYLRTTLGKAYVRVRCRIGKDRQWTADYRLKVALANNNRGRWYIATSTRSVRDLERKCAEGSWAILLYHTVGGLLGDHRLLKTSGTAHYLYVQLSMVNEDIRMCLAEQGVTLLRPIPFSDIKFV